MIFAVLQFLFILLVLCHEFRRRSTSIFLWGTLMVMFGIPHLLMLLVGEVEYPTWVLNKASVFVSLFCIFYLIGVKLCPWHGKLIVPQMTKKQIQKIVRVFIFLLLALIVVRIYILYRMTGDLLNTSWGTNRSISEESILMQLYGYFYYSFSSILLVCIYWKMYKYVIIIVLTLLLGVILSRNRMEILPIFISFIWYLLLYMKHINIKTIISIGLLAILGIYLIFALLIFRHAGSINTFLSNNIDVWEFNQSIINMFFSDDGEFGLRNVFYYFIYHDNNFPFFGEGHTYIRILLGFVPTSLSLGMKPSDFAIAMGQAWKPGSIGFSMHPTLFGDSYANFGMFGCIIGLFWGMFIGCLDSYARRFTHNDIKGLLLLILISSRLITIARGSVYNGFMGLIVGIFILNIIFYFISRRKIIFKY